MANEEPKEAEAPTPETAAPAVPAETPAPSLEERLRAAEAEAAQYKDQFLRALAESENTRRRAQRDRDEAGKYAVANLAREVLAVADNLHRALEAIPAEARASDPSLQNLAAGVELTERQLAAALERFAIRRFEPMGEKFDSNLHQAVFEVPGSGQAAGTVVQVLQAGYMIGDRLLRPAMVGVAKAEPPAEAPPGGRVDTVA